MTFVCFFRVIFLTDSVKSPFSAPIWGKIFVYFLVIFSNHTFCRLLKLTFVTPPGPRHVGTSSSQGADVVDGDTHADVVDSADAAAAIDMDLEMQKLLVARLPCREL